MNTMAPKGSSRKVMKENRAGTRLPSLFSCAHYSFVIYPLEHLLKCSPTGRVEALDHFLDVSRVALRCKLPDVSNAAGFEQIQQALEWDGIDVRATAADVNPASADSQSTGNRGRTGRYSTYREWLRRKTRVRRRSLTECKRSDFGRGYQTDTVCWNGRWCPL